MRLITISVLSVFVVLPAFARLPVVNISAGGVSARDAFGEGVRPQSTAKSVVAPVAPTRKKTVVARAASRTVATPTSIDSGEQILSSNDVLSPRRPSNDLWAKSDAALRMPTANEFSVIRSDDLLPEESLDTRVVTASVVARPDVKSTDAAPMAEIDAQIARLTELQRRADDSVRNVSSRVIAAPIANASDTVPVAPTQIQDKKIAHVQHGNSANANDADVSLRRLVVPMGDDVIVRSVEKNTSPRIVSVRDDMTKMTPSELRRAFRKTFLSENKHLSTYSIDDSFDTVSDMSSSIEGFTAQRDLSEGTDVRTLEIKIKFRNEDSALSRENYSLLTEYAGIVVNKPTRAIQIAIPEYMTKTKSERKLAARRLAIVEQVLTDNGVSQHRIVPVLSTRDEPGFLLRIISDQHYESLTKQSHNMFGDKVGSKTYKSMTW